jgi:sarcosine oxidase subunit beta
VTFALLHFYQHHTGQIIFCITPNPPIVGLDHRETSVFLPQVAKRMLEIMPCLQNIKVRRMWRGSYSMTPDGAPQAKETLAPLTLYRDFGKKEKLK